MYSYEIAGVYLNLYAEECYIYEAMKEFEIPKRNEAEVSVCLVTVEWRSPSDKALLLTDALLSIYEDSESYIICYNKPCWIHGYVNQKYTGESYIYLTEQGKRHLDNAEEGRREVMNSIRDAFFFHMQKYGRIAVHSASFEYRERVWLISAMSGTGKSTHVAKWHACGYPIVDFNGDICICYMEEGRPLAAGTPWCGTSGIYCNKKTPLGGVVFLERGAINEIYGLSEAEGIMRLAARCLTPNWNRLLMTRNLEVVDQLVPDIRCARLVCTPEKAAAEVCRSFIDRQS